MFKFAMATATFEVSTFRIFQSLRDAVRIRNNSRRYSGGLQGFKRLGRRGSGKGTCGPPVLSKT